ncbi:MAG: protein kinase [Chloroflexi bacterium]|nr:protein kinase [Chloroflexota bacterium]
MAISPGIKIGERYLVERRVGRGGFASVYLAQDLVLQRKVAIKVIIPDEISVDNDNASTTEAGKRLLELLSEARFIARHHHSNILDVYDFGQMDDEAFLVMPYASEGTLLQKLKVAGRFSFVQTGHYLDQMAAGLDYAHNLGVIHRDIKPQNIFVFSGDQVVIGDFGLAKVLASTEGFSNTRASGTPSYMSPEQFGGRVSRVSDVYSLGVVVYQMLTGQLPFIAQNLAEMMFAHIHTPPPPLRHLLPDAPPALEAVLLQVMAKDPAQRPPSAGEFARRYHQALAGYENPASLRTVPMINDPAIRPLAPDSTLPQPISTRPSEERTSTQAGLSEGGPVSIRSALTQAHSWHPTGIGGGLLAVVIVLAVLLFTNLSGSHSTPTNIASLNPTFTPVVVIKEITSTPTTLTAASLTSVISDTVTPTTAVVPPSTSVPNYPVVITSTVAPNNNLVITAPPQEQITPVSPNSNPTPTFTATPNPTFTATPNPTPTFTATSIPCGIAARRGFGQIYTTHREVAQKLGCPAQAEELATLAYEAFNGGFMLYSQIADQIYAFYSSGESGTWQGFPNTFRFSDPPPTPFASGCATLPINGFYKVWATNPTVRNRLGCPLQPENSSAGAASQKFANGTMFFYPNTRNGPRVYVLYKDGNYLDLLNTFIG